MTPLQFCDKHNACAEGREFALRFSTMAEVWEACKRPDWLLWITGKLGLDPRASVRIACRIVRETPGLWEKLTDKRSRRAVETAEAWLRGEVGVKELRAANFAAYDAANAAAFAAATTAARAAAFATLAANAAAARAAYVAYAYAADAAAATRAAAAAYATASAARAAYAAAHKQHCGIIRAEIPNPFAS